jgi:hypothetical protein
MCDICRVFKLCHDCNRNSLNGVGYSLIIYKSNKKEILEIKTNVLEYVENHNSSSDWHRRHFILEAGFCTECSKKIAIMSFYGAKGKIYLGVDIESMQVTYEKIIQFPIIKTQKTNHCTFGTSYTNIRSSWFEDDSGQIWYCRSSWGGGRFQKIKKTKKQVMKLRDPESR